MEIITNFLKLFFLLTPFFVLSMFLSMTAGWEKKAKTLLALKIGWASLVIAFAVLFCGKLIFGVFSITVDAFRIGGGVILFLSALGLVNGNVQDKQHNKKTEEQRSSSAEISNIAVVPLAIPVTVGPATIATLMVMSTELSTPAGYISFSISLVMAVAALTSMLFASSWISEKIGTSGVVVLCKITGLILAAMASQMIFIGASSFLNK